METISHRELRNQSGAVLERVRNGETIAVTNHGELAALIVPPHIEPFDLLVASGRVRHGVVDQALGFASPIRSVVSTTTVLDDLRGDR